MKKEDSYSCLLCKNDFDLKKVSFKRKHRDETIVSFTVCAACRKQMGRELIKSVNEEESE